MKNLTFNTTVTVNPTQYAINQLTIESNQNIAQVVTFSIDKANREIKPKTHSVNGKLYNVKNVPLFLRLVANAFYMQNQALNEKAIATLEQKDIEKGLTESEQFELVSRQEIATELQLILDNFKTEEIAYSKVNSFVNCVAGAYTGDFTVCSKNGASINSIVSQLATNTPDKDLKDTISKFTLSITGVEDDLLTNYHLNCNSALLNDIKSRYYKGRTFNKNGDVVRKYDDKGALITKEIALAIIEDLQKKANK